MNIPDIIDALIANHHRKIGKTPILFFHAWRFGNLEYQGYIDLLRKDGTGEAQLFDWTTGETGDRIQFTKAFLYFCTFYLSDRELRKAAEFADRNPDRIGELWGMTKALAETSTKGGAI